MDQNRENLKAAALIVMAMAVFTIEDALVKHLANHIPAGELIAIACFISGSMIVVYGLLARQRLMSRQMLRPSVAFRNAAEFVSTFFGVAALIANPLSLHSAIFQATPLMVTLGAVLYLKERPGIARYVGTLVGLLGVLLIIEPASQGFRPAILLSFASVFAVAVRDIATRTIPSSVTTLELVLASNIVAFPAGLLLMLVQGHSFVMPSAFDLTVYSLAIAIATLGGVALTIALRNGEASFVVPFRYSRIPFAIILGALVFDERISFSMLAGSALLVVAGTSVILAEGRANRRKAAFLTENRPI